MPTENELKFVLKLDDSIQYQAMEAAYDTLKIEQGYFNAGKDLTVRVRQQLNREGIIRRFLQVKFNAARSTLNDDMKIVEDGRRIEVSADINERDFEDFWKKTKARVTKTRYLIQTKTHDLHKDEEGNLWTERWDIDFMKTGDNQIYFSVAEVEIPERVKEPLFDIPGFIQENTLFRVPRRDSRFSNSRLADVGYATKLYKLLFSKEKEE